MGIRRVPRQRSFVGCLTVLAIFAVCLLSLILLTAQFDTVRCKVFGDQHACDAMYRANNVLSPR